MHADGERYLSAQLDCDTDQEGVRGAWKAFHETVAIRERTNPICQRTISGPALPATEFLWPG